jgi:hypothetical protein
VLKRVGIARHGRLPVPVPRQHGCSGYFPNFRGAELAFASPEPCQELTVPDHYDLLRLGPDSQALGIHNHNHGGDVDGGAHGRAEQLGRP